MSSLEEILSELICTLRELLAGLKLEEKSLLAGDLKMASTFTLGHQELKKKVQTLKTQLKKMSPQICPDDLEKTTLIEQQLSLEKKIHQVTKANKKLTQNPSFTSLLTQPQEIPKTKKHLIVEDNVE